MNIVKLSKDKNHQFVDLPQNYQIEGEEAYIKKVGNVILLIPKDNPWQTLFGSLELFTRTHSCSSCGVEICRDTNAAINILTKGMKVLGIEWNNSTFGQKESGSKERKLGEKTTSTIDEQSDIASGLL